MHPDLLKAYEAVRTASSDLDRAPDFCRATALQRYNDLVNELPKIAARVNGAPSSVSATDTPSATLH